MSCNANSGQLTGISQSIPSTFIAVEAEDSSGEYEPCGPPACPLFGYPTGTWRHARYGLLITPEAAGTGTSRVGHQDSPIQKPTHARRLFPVGRISLRTPLRTPTHRAREANSGSEGKKKKTKLHDDGLDLHCDEMKKN